MTTENVLSAEATSGLSPVQLGGKWLAESAHICAFFSSPDDEYRALLSFIKSGLAAGEKSFHTVDPRRTVEHLNQLLAAEIDVDGLRERGQLELRDWNQVHLRGGTFDVDGACELFAGVRQDAQARGFARTRFISHMGWCASRFDDVDQLLDYEAQANASFAEARPPCQVVCIYDLSLFRADLVIDVMRTHPLVLVGSTLYENPFCVAPEEMRRELAQRRELRTRTEP